MRWGVTGHFQGDQPTDEEKIRAYDSFTANSGRLNVEGDEPTYEAFMAKAPNYMASFQENGATATWEVDGDTLIACSSEIRSVLLRSRQVTGVFGACCWGTNHNFSPKFDGAEKPETQVLPRVPAYAPPGTRTPNLLIKRHVPGDPNHGKKRRKSLLG